MSCNTSSLWDHIHAGFSCWWNPSCTVLSARLTEPCFHDHKILHAMVDALVKPWSPKHLVDGDSE